MQLMPGLGHAHSHAALLSIYVCTVCTVCTVDFMQCHREVGKHKQLKILCTIPYYIYIISGCHDYCCVSAFNCLFVHSPFFILSFFFCCCCCFVLFICVFLLSKSTDSQNIIIGWREKPQFGVYNTIAI